jgi:nicotinamidase-related amidase
VRATWKGALAAGFDVMLLSGAHSTSDSEGKKAVEIEKEVDEEMQQVGANVLLWKGWYP